MKTPEKQTDTTPPAPVEENDRHGDQPYRPEQRTVSLLDIVLVLVRRRRLIVFSTISAALLVVLFSIYTLRMPADSSWNPLPNVYRPEVQILIQHTGDGVGDILGSGGTEIGLLAGLAGIGSIQGPTEAALAQSLLRGPTILDTVAAEFDVVERYGIQEFPTAGSRDLLRERLSSEYDDTTGILRIGYEDINPAYATQVLNRTVQLLEARFRDLTMQRVVRKRRFIEERLAEVEQDVIDAQEALVAFQREHGVIDLGGQARQAISQLTQLQTLTFEAQVELESLREYLPRNAPQIQRLERQIETYETITEEVRTGGFLDLIGPGIPQDELVELSTEYASLETDLRLQTQIYGVLRQQYETAKLEEADNSRTLQIIETADVPERKAYPSRGVISMIVTLAAFFISVFLAFLLEYISAARKDPVESEKLSAIRGSFRRRR